MTNIPQAYKYRYNGVIYIGGALPEGAELLETINRIDVKTAQTIETMDIVDPKADISDLDGKAKIDLSNINPTSAKKAEITSWGMPDYTSGVSKSANVDYTADSNGFIVAVPTAQSGESKLKIKIDGTEFMFSQGYFGTDYEHLSNGCIPIAKNSTYRITLLAGCDVRFFPCIGG